MTFARLAKYHLSRGNNERYEASKKNAIAALEAIDHFKARLPKNIRTKSEGKRPDLAQFPDALKEKSGTDESSCFLKTTRLLRLARALQKVSNSAQSSHGITCIFNGTPRVRNRPDSCRPILEPASSESENTTFTCAKGENQ